MPSSGSKWNGISGLRKKKYHSILSVISFAYMKLLWKKDLPMKGTFFLDKVKNVPGFLIIIIFKEHFREKKIIGLVLKVQGCCQIVNNFSLDNFLFFFWLRQEYLVDPNQQNYFFVSNKFWLLQIKFCWMNQSSLKQQNSFIAWKIIKSQVITLLDLISIEISKFINKYTKIDRII